MRCPILIATFSLALTAQSPPNCRGIGLDVDARCACVKDPSSKLCEMVKAGFYDSGGISKMKPINLGLTGTGIQPWAGSSRPATRPAVPARPRQARVEPLAHKDYLRFLHPNAQLIAGMDLAKLLQAPELMSAVFGASESTAALKEMDHFWLSAASAGDAVLLMTGKFEQGAMAGIFYARGIQPVFLGGAHAMMIGSEPSIQGALARLAKPTAAPGGWAARRARELSKDHETWIVSERAGTNPGTGVFQAVRQFALGFRMAGEPGLDGEVAADSDANAEAIAAWVNQMKANIQQKTGVGALDALNVERSGSTVRFNANSEALMAGDAGKVALSSDFGVELYALLMGSFPGTHTRTVAEDKLLAVKAGMKREEVLDLLGPPAGVAMIQGLETPRETWTYQIPFGKQYSVRLEGGAVSRPPSR